MYQRIIKSTIAWLPLAVMFTLVVALVYFLAQQDLRQSANDPQVQIAKDAAAVLSSGQKLTYPLLPQKVDIATSMSTFVIAVDEDQNILQSSGYLNDKVTLPPDGVFAYAKANQENRFTWQPQTDVRIAAVVQYFSGTSKGYVIVGRSLKETEERENTLLLTVLTFWVGGLILTYVTRLCVQLFLDSE
jgi:hypothetical protein